jgi:hypothetical protein
MNERINTTDQPENQHESTYTLLIRSEEKSRNVLEMAIHPLLMLGPLLAIWQFAQQPINLPAPGLEQTRCVILDASAKSTVCSDEPHARREVPHREIKG